MVSAAASLALLLAEAGAGAGAGLAFPKRNRAPLTQLRAEREISRSTFCFSEIQSGTSACKMQLEMTAEECN